MNALQAGDAMRAFKFASPANKAVTGQCSRALANTSTPSTRRIYAQVTGPWRRFKAMIEQNPEYRPMLACSRWEFVGMLGDDERKAARVRVFPAGGSSAPFAVQTPVIEYTFSLSKQPVVTDAGEEGLCRLRVLVHGQRHSVNASGVSVRFVKKSLHAGDLGLRQDAPAAGGGPGGGGGGTEPGGGGTDPGGGGGTLPGGGGMPGGWA